MQSLPLSPPEWTVGNREALRTLQLPWLFLPSGPAGTWKSSEMSTKIILVIIIASSNIHMDLSILLIKFLCVLWQKPEYVSYHQTSVYGQSEEGDTRYSSSYDPTLLFYIHFMKFRKRSVGWDWVGLKKKYTGVLCYFSLIAFCFRYDSIVMVHLCTCMCVHVVRHISIIIYFWVIS